jgi:SAM-dependent methyltransferase
MSKADYGRIAKTYDAGRPISEQNLQRWMEIISKIIGPPPKYVLDLGCGTGRFTIPMAVELGYNVTGADNSQDMIAEAGKKLGADKVTWDVQQALSLTYPGDTFHAVFMSHLLHHVEEPVSVIRECYRVLRQGGVIINRYGAIEDIINDPEHTFFPKTIEIDKARTPSLTQVEEWFRTTGFSDITSMTVEQKTYQSAEERLEKCRLKSTSVLTLICQPDFEQGLKALQQYILDNPADLWILMDKITLTTGRK